MICALLAMPLAMPLDKMAQGDDSKCSSGPNAGQAVPSYLADRGCIWGAFKFNPAKLANYGANTYSEGKMMLSSYETEKPDVDPASLYMLLLSAPNQAFPTEVDGDTLFNEACIMSYANGLQGSPWDADPPSFWFDGCFRSVWVYVSCPLEFADAPAALTVHGDPMFQHNGKGQHFWIKEGVLTALLDWESDDGHKMSLQGLTVANTETGHQWFKQIALVSDGEQVFGATTAVGTKPVLSMFGGASSVGNTTTSFDVETKFVGPKANQKAVTTIKAGGMAFELTAESAHKFADAAQQKKFAHINVKMPEGLVKGATGLFAELAGAQPVSEATKAMLRTPK